MDIGHREKADTAAEQRGTQIETCGDACLNCYKECLQAISYSLEKGGPLGAPEHINLLLSCARMCQTSAEFMITSSPLHVFTCKACSDICQRCGDNCMTFNEDSHMSHCAEICFQCANECRNMAAQ